MTKVVNPHPAEAGGLDSTAKSVIHVGWIKGSTRLGGEDQGSTSPFLAKDGPSLQRQSRSCPISIYPLSRLLSETAVSHAIGVPLVTLCVWRTPVGDGGAFGEPASGLERV